MYWLLQNYALVGGGIYGVHNSVHSNPAQSMRQNLYIKCYPTSSRACQASSVMTTTAGLHSGGSRHAITHESHVLAQHAGIRRLLGHSAVYAELTFNVNIELCKLSNLEGDSPGTRQGIAIPELGI